jgi:multicomponent Na+:H+ antiporter subunit E
MIRYVSLALVLMGIWLLLSGHYDSLFIGLGILSVTLTTWLAARLNVVDTEGHPIHIALRLFTYAPWLF